MNLRPLGYEPVGFESRPPSCVPPLAVDLRLQDLECLTCSPASCPHRGVPLTNPLASAPDRNQGSRWRPTKGVVEWASLSSGGPAVRPRPCLPPPTSCCAGQAAYAGIEPSLAPYVSDPLRDARCVSAVARGVHDRQWLRQDSRDFATSFGGDSQATQQRVSSLLIRRSRRSVRWRPYIRSPCAFLSVRAGARALSCAGLAVTLAVSCAVVPAL